MLNEWKEQNAPSFPLLQGRAASRCYWGKDNHSRPEPLVICRADVEAEGTGACRNVKRKVMEGSKECVRTGKQEFSLGLVFGGLCLPIHWSCVTSPTRLPCLSVFLFSSCLFVLSSSAHCPRVLPPWVTSVGAIYGVYSVGSRSDMVNNGDLLFLITHVCLN